MNLHCYCKILDYGCGIYCFKQNPAYDMRISAWSSDVCSSDLEEESYNHTARVCDIGPDNKLYITLGQPFNVPAPEKLDLYNEYGIGGIIRMRSEEHTSELQSLMRISYAVFCLKKKKNQKNYKHYKISTNKKKNAKIQQQA